MELTAEKIEEIFEDKDSRKKMIMSINLVQQLRYLEKEMQRLQSEMFELNYQLQIKHDITAIQLMFLRAELEAEKYVDWLKNYEKIKKREKNDNNK